MKNGSETAPPAAQRFYKSVAPEATGQGWRILLDGRVVKTPNRAELLLPTAALAEAVAAEWDAQGARVDPASMPLTKLANTAIDAVAPNLVAVAEDVLGFAGRDLICYRAELPESLIERQAASWDPLIAWAEEHYGARLVATEGIMPLDQPPQSLSALRTALTCLDPFALAAVHVMTSLTGSAVLALAHAAGRLSLEETWGAAHIDEDFQTSQWGEDEEARRRRATRFAEMSAASAFLRLSRRG
jgi:chaperone required for assembly of F1-ATPase